MSSFFTTRELGKFVADLPDNAEVLIVASVGQITTMYWTPGVLATKSPTSTPAPKRWARELLAGFCEATNAPFPGDGPPSPPQIGRA